jgi:hypothetical protein
VTARINPLPLKYNVSGGGSFCSGGIGVPVGLDSSELNTFYQLLFNGTVIKDSIPGTGSALNFGNQLSAGTYSVKAFKSCTNTMNGTVTVSINPLPNIFTITGGGAYCSGGTGVGIGLGGSQIGVNYSLVLNGNTLITIAGTGKAISFGNQTQAGIYSSIAVNASTGCSNKMGKTATITIKPLPPAPIAGSNSPVCQGSQLALTASTVTGANYTWTGPNNFTSTVKSPVINNVSVAAAGVYSVQSHLNGCASISASTSVIIYANNAAPITGITSVCVNGTTQLYNTNPNGTWSSSNVSVATVNSSGLVTGLAAGSPTITYTFTNANNCTSKATATVKVNALPNVYTVSGGGTICSNSSGAPVNMNGSQSIISYRLLLNGIVIKTIAGNGKAVLNFGNQTSAGTYTVVAYNPTTQCSRLMNGSASILVNQAPAVAIPDSFAYNPATAVLPNTIYPAYKRAASLNLTANVNGGLPPYSNLVWKNSLGTIVASGTYSLKVIKADTYTFSVTDSKNCVSSLSKTINAVDVICNSVVNGIQLCSNGTNMCVDSSNVAAILNNGSGYYLGSCQVAAPSNTRMKNVKAVTTPSSNIKNSTFSNGGKMLIHMLNVKASPNPSISQFTLKMESDNIKEPINLRVMNIFGNVIEVKTKLYSGQTMLMGNNYRPGVYIVEVSQGENKKQLKLIKL